MAYRIERSIMIQAPPQQVWELVQNPARRMEWDVRTTHVELLTPLPIGVGARTHVLYNMGGTQLDVELELVSWQPHQRSGVKGVFRNSADTIGASWTFSADADGATTWTTKIVLTTSGRFARLREQLYGRTTALLTTMSQRNVQRLVETEWRQGLVSAAKR